MEKTLQVTITSMSHGKNGTAFVAQSKPDEKDKKKKGHKVVFQFDDHADAEGFKYGQELTMKISTGK